MSKSISSAKHTTPEITELHRLHRDLDQITSLMERQQQRRVSLLAMAAHDLRTPLAIIQGYAQLLATEPAVAANQDVAEYLANIVVHADALGIMLENLFTLDQLARHELRLSLTRADLTELVAQAIAQTEGLARVKGIALELQRPEGAGPWVSADTAQIGRVLYNLIGHTIKYARPDSRLAVVVDRDGAYGRMQLCDPQRVLSAEILAQLFDPIDTNHNGIASLRGMDMGLVLARQVAEAHDGAAEADCKLGQGVTLCLRLPLSES